MAQSVREEKREALVMLRALAFIPVRIWVPSAMPVQLQLTIAGLQQNGRLVRVSAAGVREAHPHDVKIIKEAPNYSLSHNAG